MPKNIARIALEVKAYAEAHPGQSYSLMAENFNVSRARISQLLKIIDNLPAYLIKKIQETEDPIVLRKFSGKRLLRLASFQTQEHMESAIEALMPL